MSPKEFSESIVQELICCLNINIPGKVNEAINIVEEMLTDYLDGYFLQNNDKVHCSCKEEYT